MKKRNLGTYMAFAFGAAVIIYVMASGGVHAEKADEVRMEKEYGYTESDTAVYDSTDHSTDYLRTTERQMKGEENEEIISVVEYIEPGPVYTPDPYEETEEELYTVSEVLNEERVTRETNSDYADDSTDPDSVGDSVWTAETADVAVEPVDVWDMGLEWYGISYEDTNRTLRLITYEGYGNSMLSYYVACCCWVRATEGYWGYGNLYSAFGEIDTQYGLWMDSLEIADWAYYYLEMCYREPTYCKYVNGLVVPSEYIYYEDGIYVWN